MGVSVVACMIVVGVGFSRCALVGSLRSGVGMSHLF
jgi:hypothetical protein